MSLRPFLMRHRLALQDFAFVLGVVLLAGLGAYEFSFTGSVEADKRIDFEEMLLLGAVVVVAILYLGWRRVRDQEREINRRIAAERRAHELAHTDPLTGLANRRELEGEVAASIDASPGAEEVHAVLMLDLNGFKRINDVFGHMEGDDLLVVVAGRLRTATRSRDLAARVGGDEFAVVARHLAGAEGAMKIAVRILKELEAPIRIDTREHRIGTGIGIALLPRDGSSADELLRKADIALYRAKSETGSAICFFEEEMDRHVRERDRLERELAAAIGTDQLRPWYQPILDLESGRVIEFEALARWAHPVLGDISPERFITIAESCGLIRDLSDWLLRCAARDACRWPEHVGLSFNLSPTQLKDPTTTERILDILRETGFPPRRLEIEITESAIVRDVEAARAILSDLRAQGISIALDDFGTGYSSLYHLRSFKLDKIKIDRSFIHTMCSETDSAAIVRALVGLGNGLDLTVTAEGIESRDECEELQRQGCRQGQGYLFSRAVPAAETDFFFAPDTANAKRLSAEPIATWTRGLTRPRGSGPVPRSARLR
jgi:diguanylate cyclase (GGDEF)-like protein